MRWLWPLLIVVTLVFGASHASVLVNAMLGSWSATAIEQDGSATSMQFGQSLPRPDWVPVYPNATIVQASKITPAHAPSGFQGLELSTRASLEDVKRFDSGVVLLTYLPAS